MDAKAKSYLMKQLAVEKNIVTYRSLSRALSIHVKLAKQYLSQYLEDVGDCHPQYLVSGVPRPTAQSDGDWDMNEETSSRTGVSSFRCALVGPNELDEVKNAFESPQIYVHNLAPSVIQDSSLIAGVPWDIVRKADAAGGSEHAEVVGRIVGADVKQALAKRGKGKARAKAVAKPTALAASKAKDATTTVPVSAKSEPAVAEAKKLKAAGTLDWSKAKAKDAKKPEDTTKGVDEASAKGKTKASASASTKSKPEVKAPADDKPKALQASTDSRLKAPQRGQKRKSDLPDDSDAGNSSARSSKASPAPEPTVSKASSSTLVDAGDKAASSKLARRKNNIVLSDEEEDEHVVRAPVKARPATKNKRKALAGSDDEDDLDKMMKLDDDEVVRASASRQATTPPDTDDGMSTIDHLDAMDMDDDMDDIPKPKRKKKEKKVVPVGENGLPKRRIVKTRTTMDAKGFMVAEDYSEYESVDEEEPEPTKAPAAGKKPKATSSSTAKKKADVPAPKAAPMKKAAPAPPKGNQKGIGNFFTKKT